MFNNSSEGLHDGQRYQLLHTKVTKVTWSLPLCFCSVSQGKRVPNSLDHHPLLSFGTSLHRLLMFWPALQDLFRGCLEPLGFCWARRGSGIDTRCSLAKAVKPAAGFLHTRNVCIRDNSITNKWTTFSYCKNQYLFHTKKERNMVSSHIRLSHDYQEKLMYMSYFILNEYGL